ncbi:MAG: hypothetical protein K1000chlam2_00765 [Chlamydiae bacterium]|nr:hypothetical protein [Chlamydiota bacterium]
MNILHAISNLSKQMVSYYIFPEYEKLFSEVSPFQPNDWREYFGVETQNVQIPQEALDYLEQPCPFWNGKSVKETHFLFFVPETLNGKAPTPKNLNELVKGREDFYNFSINEEADKPAEGPYWALITKKIIPESQMKVHEERLELLERNFVEYHAPKTSEVIMSILAMYAKDKVELFHGGSRSTHCLEKVRKISPVSIYSYHVCPTHPLVISVLYNDWENPSGLAAIRTFKSNR